MSSSTSRVIILRSSDGDTFEVDEAAAAESQTIKYMIEDCSADTIIPLPNVTSEILSKVIEYCKKHVETPKTKTDYKMKSVIDSDDVKHVETPETDEIMNSSDSDDEAVDEGSSKKKKKKKKTVEEILKSFDAEFVKVDGETLFDLALAANYLNIKSLLDLTCQAVADIMKGKSPEDIRKHFNIKNDFTPEEEAKVRQDNAWAFE